MAKFILILFGIVVIFIMVTSYILGAIRRLFGIIPMSKQGKADSSSKVPPEQTAIYKQGEIEVLVGESHQELHSKKNTPIREASFSDKLVQPSENKD